MANDVSATIAGLERLKERVNEATRQSVADVLHLFQAAGMGHAPVGVTGNSTNMPGDLRRSILVDGPHAMGDDTWEGKVGPTVVYGRQRELGGPIEPKVAKALAFTKFGTRFVIGPGVYPHVGANTVYLRRSGVYQHGAHYMLKGYEEVLPSVEDVVDAQIAEAIRGA